MNHVCQKQKALKIYISQYHISFCCWDQTNIIVFWKLNPNYNSHHLLIKHEPILIVWNMKHCCKTLQSQILLQHLTISCLLTIWQYITTLTTVYKTFSINRKGHKFALLCGEAQLRLPYVFYKKPTWKAWGCESCLTSLP